MKKIIGIVVVVGFMLLGTSTFTGLNTTSLEREKPTLSFTSSLQQRDTYHMVIITPSEFSLVLQPLIDHKNNHNISWRSSIDRRGISAPRRFQLHHSISSTGPAGRFCERRLFDHRHSPPEQRH